MNVMAFHLRRPTEDRDATFFLLLHLGLCLTRARHLTRRHTPGLCLPPAVSHMHTYLLLGGGQLKTLQHAVVRQVRSA